MNSRLVIRQGKQNLQVYCRRTAKKVPRSMARKIPEEIGKNFNFGTKERTSSAKLLEQLTPEFINDKIFQTNASMNKFRIDHVSQCINKLNLERFPLPESMTIAQWKKLTSFHTREAQVYYIEAVLDGKSDDVELLNSLERIEDQQSIPLTCDQEILDRLLGNDEELNVSRI